MKSFTVALLVGLAFSAPLTKRQGYPPYVVVEAPRPNLLEGVAHGLGNTVGGLTSGKLPPSRLWISQHGVREIMFH